MLAKRKITCAEFRKTDMVDWLNSLGFKPVRIDDKEAWYISFFRKGEKNASLRVNIKLQLFIDYGDSKYSGDIIKLGCSLFNTDVKGLLQHLNNESFFFRQHIFSDNPKTQEPGIKVLLVDEISDPKVVSYIRSRCISLEIAQKYCKQITYIAGGHKYMAIGILNIQNEWELRIPYSEIKLCTKKAITIISNNSDSVCLFEGFFDMLSFMKMTPNFNEFDLISLNSVKMLPQAMPYLIHYKIVKTYFDNDNRGGEATGVVLAMGLSLCINMSKEFKEKDLNAHLVALNRKKDKNEITIQEDNKHQSLGMGV
jgi:hypothetical protein